ncbi:putative inorganic phosphate cotransporter [Daphnia pulex]|uniref:putative inorganic phosphate cotransporter n=1 Tax=Daphnia pulex TaxID=6669 RepID=UPI001EDCAA73|nr:putative inorganic phosphate cotransporter [Daphnia pulex]XP_046451174.1 putative inorganic phosphate cotransporter [Daphnia pulex]
MTDTPSKVNEDEKESKQPLPSDAIFVIATNDHQQPLDKATKSVQEGAIESTVQDVIQHGHSLENGDSQIVDKPKDFFGSRHVFAFMGFLGLASVYMMRINLSVAIVDMVRTPSGDNATSFFGRSGGTSASNSTEQCEYEEDSGSSESNGEFDWDGETQGLILGAFFWGYMVTQIPGGILAEKYGGKYVLGLGILLTDFFSVLTPLAARQGGANAVIVMRVLTGLAEGVSFPAANSMVSKWVPTFERTTIGAFVLAGTQFGTVIIMPLSGWLCSLEFDNGWPLAFYVPGIIGVIWFTLWVFLVFDSPSVHPRIAEDEKRYILASTGIKKPIPMSETPWKTILTSIHLWAILVAHLGHSWGLSMLLTELPTYMKTVLHFDLKANGALSALPYLAMWLFSIAFSVTADAIRKNKILNTTYTRKVFTTIGLLLPACGLIGVSYTGCDRVATITLLTVSCGFNGAIYSGFLANHIDIASNFAGTMMGVTNCVASICGFLAPYIVNLIVTESGSLDQWQTVFFLSAGIYAATNLFYVVFSTGVEQPWNKINRDPILEQRRNESISSMTSSSSSDQSSKSK